jgi:D-lactate dehydrogenase (quinone)
LLDNTALIAQLKIIVGKRYVLTEPERTRRFCTGFRFGRGPAMVVVQPGSLVEQWRVIRTCVAANTIVIMQAANTGLTGGSTPDGDDYDRGIVIISTLRMATVYVIDEGRQVICLPGATLYQLENVLRPFGRTPHSVIGSSCIGASVFGGICNNSGGSLIQRGPAYTQMALFARLDETGALHLVNHLGLKLGEDPEAMLARLDRGEPYEEDIEYDSGSAGSDGNYSEHVRDVGAESPARFNADPRRLYEASGSAGRVILFAVRLDTFAKDETAAVFYVGSNSAAELESIRRHVLTTFESLPIAGEYIHRGAFNLAETYGKDMFLAIHHLGTARLPALFALKARLDSWSSRCSYFPRDLSDRLMQFTGRLFPAHLPKRITEYRDRFEHHLMLKMAGSGIAEARAYLNALFPSQYGACFECTAEEGEKAFLHRFAVAGAAIRYRAIHRDLVEDIVSLDIALRRNDWEWLERLPPDVQAPITHAIYYGHFFCHVFHQDYIVAKGHDIMALERTMWRLLDARGAEYPAEHNVGHLYSAKPALAEHYRSLDPCNAFNPGIGRTSKLTRWR